MDSRSPRIEVIIFAIVAFDEVSSVSIVGALSENRSKNEFLASSPFSSPVPKVPKYSFYNLV
jgi:hypothetical protein